MDLAKCVGTHGLLQRHILVGGPTQATVPFRSWDSVRDVAPFQAQSRNHVHGNYVAPWTVCDVQWAMDFTSMTMLCISSVCVSCYRCSLSSGHCEPSSSCHSSYFCELELLCDRDGCVADAAALPRDSDNATSSSSSDRKSSGLSRKHLLNPGYHTTAVECRRIRCLFRQPQVKAQLEDSALHSAENQRYSQFCQKHDVLDPNGTSEDITGRRGRKAWPKGVVGKRTCRNRKAFFRWLNFSWDLRIEE